LTSEEERRELLASLPNVVEGYEETVSGLVVLDVPVKGGMDA
jgi:hypothetical protein